MTSKNFEEIFQLIKDDITKENTKMKGHTGIPGLWMLDS